MDLTELKSYKARGGYTIKTVISGADQGDQNVYSIQSLLVSPSGKTVYSRLCDGWAAFSKAEAKKIRTEQVQDCREQIPA